jgi:hypothetical protein
LADHVADAVGLVRMADHGDAGAGGEQAVELGI